MGAATNTVRPGHTDILVAPPPTPEIHVTRSIRSTASAASRAAGLAVVLALTTADAAPAAPRQEPDILRTELVIRPDIAERKLSVEATLDIANPGGKNAFTFLLADWYAIGERR